MVHTLDVIIQLIFSGERTITGSFTARTSCNAAPVDDWSSCMGSIVMSLEVIPSSKGLFLAAWVITPDDIGIWFAGAVNGPDEKTPNLFLLG
jgi:hypothetical protein